MQLMIRALVVPVFAIAVAHAQVPEPAPSDSTASPVEEILVTGEQPGPGLWKISKGDHVLWLLGTQSPLPKKMTWRSDEVEHTIADSQEVIAGPAPNAHVGFFSGLALLPSLIGVRNNPNGKLQDVLPADLYARWHVLKEKYIGRDNDPEKWRPIFAAYELYSKAIDKSGLTMTNIAWPVVEKAAKKNKVTITTPTVNFEISKPRSIIKEFKKSPLDDLDCFAKTIERLETDLDLMRVRANAWARGDIPALKRMPHIDQLAICLSSALNTQLVQERGYQDIPIRLRDAWLNAADYALKINRSSFAVLSTDEILKPDGWVAQLLARGYSLQEP